MKTLYTYINESLLDDEDVIAGDFVRRQDHNKITEFLRQNYYMPENFTISSEPVDGKYVVDCAFDIQVKILSLKSLTNEQFVWGKVGGRFTCTGCKLLKTLKGGPEKVDGDFDCKFCDSLKTLEGAPKKVGGDFNCTECKSLKTLEGAPKKVGGDFRCGECKLLKTLQGAPENVGGDFICAGCQSLKTLDGAPKEVGGAFLCYDCKSLKSYDVDSNIKKMFIN